MSGSLYVPDQIALDTVTQPWSEAFRTQRDVGLRVPVNYLTAAATSLRTSCFSHNQYENAAFQKCFSNLLAVGFRRFVVDVYWDAARSVWSLCPVEVPASESNSEVSPVAGLSLALSTISPEASVTAFRPRRRQDALQTDSASSFSPPAEASSTPPSTPSPQPTAPNPPETSSIVSFPTDHGMPLFQIGEYNCTSTMTLSLLTGILDAFLDKTMTTVDARVTFLILNIHAAASLSAPDAPAQQPGADQMPAPGNLLSNIVKGNLSSELYTPRELQEERANLHDSWFDTDWDLRPMRGYYQTSNAAAGHVTTQDGWPTEAHMEFKEYFRLVSGFGSIDPQMANYDITADLEKLFAPDVIQSYRSTSFDTEGGLTSGCLFDASKNTITSTTNSSWAISSTPNINIRSNPDIEEPITAVINSTSCGISPWLNSTLTNVTADENPLPYAAFVHSTLWSWAPGEPQNATTTEHGSTHNRCAAMNTTVNPGRWHTVDCRDRYRVACHDPADPYHWRISDSRSDYVNAASVCSPDFAFSVPHTALENAHLLTAIRTESSPRDTPDEPILLNLNSLQVRDCWALSINGTCPYLPPSDSDRVRIVVVPTIAAVIVFLCAALTFFLKCASNRREDKRGRRRRMVGGWEYEGVPS